MNIMAQTAAKQQSLEEVETVKLSANNLAQKVAAMSAQSNQMGKDLSALKDNMQASKRCLKLSSKHKNRRQHHWQS